MTDRIAQALTKLFDRHRIVFWYDAKRELRDDYEALSLPGVENVEIVNNEYGIKYRVLREQPEQKFLLFRDGPEPAPLDNWLLDVQLGHGEFRTDQVAIWLSELELGLEFSDLVQEHIGFFSRPERKDALKNLLKPQDTAGQIRLKMLAVCAGSEPRIDSVLEHLLQELAEGQNAKIKEIDDCGLGSFFWDQMTRCYGYTSEAPSIRDFVIELFKSCFAMGTDGPVRLSGDALVFLKRWKDSRQFETSFEKLSAECAEVLSIEHNLAKRDFRRLLELDFFRLIDQKIISDLVREVSTRTVTHEEVSHWIRQRRQGHWYQEFSHLYDAIEYAAQFHPALHEANLTMDTLAEGVERYSTSWFRLDQLYRKFIYHVRKSGQATLMATLVEQVENLYTNNYLLKLGDRFQSVVDTASKWDASPHRLQRDFFSHWVRPFLTKGVKVCVIISDAMRYEIGEELLGLIRQENRYSAELEPALSMLPSYTQLGMAALLPNQKLEIVEGDTGAVLVDGRSSQGTANRQKILSEAIPERVVALKADELLAMRSEDSRELVRDHNVIYIYHNHIDAVGDKRDTEERVFEASEDALHELLKLIKRLVASNVSNVLVTADHGFIYQNRPLEESDFVAEDATGEQILFRDRRFVLGKGLAQTSSLRSFTPAQLGLAGDMEVQVPKSINRLRLKGSGSRFVHGGASLQEVVIPVLKIHKGRQSDVSVVDVDILGGANTLITSGQLAVTLYQSGPVTDKIQSRELRAGIFTEAGELISDSHVLTFDLTSENPRDREVKVRFVLSRSADEANGQEVILRLEEKHAGTSHYREYKSRRYLMRRAFTSDFDF